MRRSVSRFVLAFIGVAVLSVCVLTGSAAAAWKQQSAAACYLYGTDTFSSGGARGVYVFCPVEETDSFRVNSVTALKLDFSGPAYVGVCSVLAGGFGAVCSPMQYSSGSGTDWKTVSGSALDPWSDPHTTAAFRYFVLVLGSDTSFRGYLLEYN